MGTIRSFIIYGREQERNGMKQKLTIPGELSLTTGLVLLAFAVPLMLNAGIGTSTIASPLYALNSICDNISFGTWNLVFQVSLLIILLMITKEFKSGYLASFIITTVFGYMVDLFTGTLANLPTDLPWLILYFVSSLVLFCVSISLMVLSKLPMMITDSFVKDLSRFFHVTFRRMKTLFDISCISLSVGLSMVFLGNLAAVGVGTLIMALTTGLGVHALNKAISKVVTIKPWSNTLASMAKLKVDQVEK
jgi:uncharacterized membrane protein YczE